METGGFGVFLASQLSLVGEHQASERLCIKKTRWTPPPNTQTHTQRHTCMYMRWGLRDSYEHLFISGDRDEDKRNTAWRERASLLEPEHFQGCAIFLCAFVGRCEAQQRRLLECGVYGKLCTVSLQTR